MYQKEKKQIAPVKLSEETGNVCDKEALMLPWVYLRDSINSKPALSCSGWRSPWRTTEQE